jgi:hypothetical protein
MKLRRDRNNDPVDLLRIQHRFKSRIVAHAQLGGEGCRTRGRINDASEYGGRFVNAVLSVPAANGTCPYNTDA